MKKIPLISFLILFLKAVVPLQAEYLWEAENPTPPVGRIYRLIAGADGRMAGPYELLTGLAVTDDGVNWRWERTSVPHVAINDGIYVNGAWYFCSRRQDAATNTVVQRSTDLKNWTSTIVPSRYLLRSITYGNGKFWLVGGPNYVSTAETYSSTDGINWSLVAGSNITFDPKSVAYDPVGNVLVAAGTDISNAGKLATSPNGVTWTLRATTPSSDLNYVRAANNIVIACGGTTNMYRSVNGTTWTSISVPAGGTGYSQLTSSNGTWVAINYSGGVIKSVDNGVTWSSAAGTGWGVTYGLQGIAFRSQDNTFYASGSYGLVAATANLANAWPARTKGTMNDFVSVDQGNGRIVAAGYGAIYSSPNGTNWTDVTPANSSTINYRNVRFLNGAFYVYAGTRVAYSADGVTFQQYNAGTINDGLYDGTKFLAWRGGFTNFYTSANGTNYTVDSTLILPNIGNPWMQKFGSLYVMVDPNYFGSSTFYSSTDLKNWTTNKVTWNSGQITKPRIFQVNGKYILPRDFGTFASNDGVTWTNLDINVNAATGPFFLNGNRIYGVMSPNQSSGGLLAGSDDGVTWTPVSGYVDRPPGVALDGLYNGTTVVQVSSSGSITSITLPLSPGTSSAPSFTSWKSSYTFPPGQEGPDNDPDGDKLKNIVEFAFGSSPVDMSSRKLPGGTSVDVNGVKYPAVTYVRNKNTTGVSILVVAGSDISFTSTLAVTEVTPTQDLGDGTERVTVRTTAAPNASASVFFKISVSGQ